MKDLTENWYALLSKRAASRPAAKSFGLVLAVCILVLNLYAPAEPTLTERALASAILLVAFGSIWRWIYRGRGVPELGFLPVFLIVYSLQYALPIFTLKVYSMQVFTTESLAASSVEKSLLLALIGLICILIGYYHPWRRSVARALPKPRMRWWNKNAVQLVSVCLAGFGLVVFLITFQLNLSPEIQAYVSLPSEFCYLAIVALLVLQLERELKWSYAVLLWAMLIPLRGFIGLLQGQFGTAMFEASALLITFVTVRRRIPWMVFAVGFAAFFVMQPVKGVLRSMVFAGGWINREQDQSQKIEALAVASQVGMVAVENLDPEDLLAMATNRLASIMVLASVVDLTPSYIPYWGGATFYPLLFVAVPRFIYPEKPNDLPGNVFGHQYGILPTDDWQTSVNVTQLVDLYGNWGPLGVILGSILIGVIYRTVHDLFLNAHSGLGSLVAGLYLFTHLSDIENAPSAIFGGLLFQLIVVVMFHGGVRLTEELFKVSARNHSLTRSGFYVSESVVEEIRK